MRTINKSILSKLNDLLKNWGLMYSGCLPGENLGNFLSYGIFKQQNINNKCLKLKFFFELRVQIFLLVKWLILPPPPSRINVGNLVVYKSHTFWLWNFSRHPGIEKSIIFNALQPSKIDFFPFNVYKSRVSAFRRLFWKLKVAMTKKWPFMFKWRW